jgi:hypothetical protein
LPTGDCIAQKDEVDLPDGSVLEDIRMAYWNSMINEYRLTQDLDFLTGPATSGRLSGTPGVYQAATYLREELEAAGFQPVNGKTYLQAVNVPAARLIETPRLIIADKVLTYRRDFAEITALSAGGFTTGQLLVIREADQLLPATLARRIVLIPERPQNFDLEATIKAAVDLDVAALLVEQGDPRWFHKTVYTGRGRIPVLRLRKSLAQELAYMPGAAVELELPLESATRPCQNVLGLLRGEPDEFNLALTAHYDHVGDDPGGVRFPGAFDNASGVATMLAVARQLASGSERLPFNLLIGFLTGEESGLWGAWRLLSHSPLPLSAVINLDGIGSEMALRAMRLGHTRRDDWLAEMAAQVLEEQGITPQWASGRDDSSVFISAGIPTVGLGQQSTHPGRSEMHTPLDTNEALHLETIWAGVQVILDIIKKLVISEIYKKENTHV